MGTWSYIKGVFVATWSGVRHLSHPRMTLRYPEQKLDLEGPGYQFDAKKGVGLPGFKGRHILLMDKCTGCQLCAIACDGIAVAIEMQHVQKGKPQNKKDIWPAVDYGRCVFCGLCVDACPFDALFMTNDYELSAYDKESLKYTPDMLAIPPKLEGQTYKVKFDTEKGTTKHG
ncbi:MAG: NADH-quinone oxidoreductase subunit I [Nitrososphaerales archaeon]|nr:NADH-quinone oxidoreductase subunit I [Nitrososphaerales archaeon]